tara:strand:- start:408 stop:878 length:471 start_codon:yes stop_codon:yes gene_type:complete
MFFLKGDSYGASKLSEAYTPLNDDELFVDATWNKLAEGSDFDLDAEKGGVLFSYVGSTARVFKRAVETYRLCSDDGHVFRWVCFWGVVIGFMLVEKLAEQKPKKAKKSEEASDSQPKTSGSIPGVKLLSPEALLEAAGHVDGDGKPDANHEDEASI